jgi:hypothetical protein
MFTHCESTGESAQISLKGEQKHKSLYNTFCPASK